MKKTLTKLEEKLMVKVRDEWLHRIFDCKIRTNKKQATKYINWLYELSGYKKPMVIFLSSPLGAQYGANILKDKNFCQVSDQVRDQVWDQVSDQVRDQVWDQVSGQVSGQVRDQVWGQVWDQVWDQVSGQVRGQVSDQVSDQVWDQVSDQVSGQVRDQVWGQVRGQVRGQELEFFGFCSYGNISDYGWNSFYDFFTRIKVINNEKFNNFMFLLKSGIYDMIQFEKICIVSDMPTKINRDEQNRLHQENGYAIEWADGYGQYFWHGIPVSEKIILHPEKLTKKDWMNEKNIEVRRCIQEKLGELFVTLLNGKTINKGTRGELIEIDLKEDPDKVAHYVKVKDTSTAREYYLRTPPTIMTADESIAWTFGLEVKTYKPSIES